MRGLEEIYEEKGDVTGIQPKMKWRGALGMQSQLVCSGCGNMLLYPRGAPNVCCGICNTITPGMEMSHLVCGGCGTLLMYTHGAPSVRCACCRTINHARTENVPNCKKYFFDTQIKANQVARVNCGQCRTTLMYPSGAPSVKCAVCQFVTNVVPLPHAKNQTVVVENPMTVDDSGKLVSNVVVGVTNIKK